MSLATTNCLWRNDGKICQKFCLFQSHRALAASLIFDIVHFWSGCWFLNIAVVNCVKLYRKLGLLYTPVVIRPKNSFGGIGGQYIKPIRPHYPALLPTPEPEIQIIGTGGVGAGCFWALILCGASMVEQPFIKKGGGLRAHHHQNSRLLWKKKAESLEDFREGNLLYKRCCDLKWNKSWVDSHPVFHIILKKVLIQYNFTDSFYEKIDAKMKMFLWLRLSAGSWEESTSPLRVWRKRQWDANGPWVESATTSWFIKRTHAETVHLIYDEKED